MLELELGLRVRARVRAGVRAIELGARLWIASFPGSLPSLYVRKKAGQRAWERG